MNPAHSDTETASRRSRTRAQILLALDALGEATPAQISRFAGIRRDRVVGALLGDGTDFRRELSPVALGLVASRQVDRGFAFRLLPRGREEAQRLDRALTDETLHAKRERDLARARWSRLREKGENAGQEAQGRER